jgi:hypothetical protein
MNTSIYDKTAKGREEIATRKFQLAPRMRTLLVLIDGRKSEEELLRSVSGLGLTADSIAELQAQEFIVLATSYSAELVAEVAPIAPIAPIATAPAPAAPIAPAPSAVPAAVGAPPPLVAVAAARAETEAKAAESPAEQFQSLYDFYNKTIKSTIGLRGFTLQLKVEKASSVDELRDLRRPYLEAVLKAKGSDIARTLANQLDQLLGNAPDSESLSRPYD